MALWAARDNDDYCETCLYLEHPLLNENGRWYADNKLNEVLVVPVDHPISPPLAELVRPLQLQPGDCIEVKLTRVGESE